MKKNVALLEFENNPNIGLFMFANDKVCFVGIDIDEKKKKQIEEVLNVPVHKIKVLGTDLVGVFLSGNNNFILAPELFEHEREQLSSVLEQYSMDLIIVSHRFNTLGNGFCVADEEIVADKNYPKTILSLIEKESGLKVFSFNSNIFSGPGSVMIFKNGKYFISQEIEEEEVTEIVDKVAAVGSVNSGSSYISSGVVGNKFGILLGSMCSTVEIQNLVENLDYL